MRRLSYIQQQVLALLTKHHSISYTDIAAELDVDRSSVMIAVKQLQLREKIEKLPGKGRIPNTYQLRGQHESV
jgi:DNA-binding MarR family transcriptional regulator